MAKINEEISVWHLDDVSLINDADLIEHVRPLLSKDLFMSMTLTQIIFHECNGMRIQSYLWDQIKVVNYIPNNLLIIRIKTAEKKSALLSFTTVRPEDFFSSAVQASYNCYERLNNEEE